jgi:large subunit ribosomal protein L4
MKLDIWDHEGRTVGTVDADVDFLLDEVNPWVLYEAVRVGRAKLRKGSASTLTTSRVAGSTRKPWRQKGTGRARAGSRKSALWQGGATTFGPHPRDYGYRVPKAVRRAALRSALADRFQEGRFYVLDDLRLPEAKTREVAKLFSSLSVPGKALVVLAEGDLTFERASRNVRTVQTVLVDRLNVLDILNCDSIVIERRAVEKLGELVL